MFQDDEIDPQLETIASLRQQVRELSELLDCVKSEREQQLAEQKRLTALVYRAADPLKKQLAECQARTASDGWRQCAKGQRTTQYCGLTEEAIRQAVKEFAEGLTAKFGKTDADFIRRMAEEMFCRRN